MIKWFIGLIVKSKKATDQQIDEAIGRLNQVEYMKGLKYANLIWNTSPPAIARQILNRKMDNVSKPYENAIFDFLQSRNGAK